MFQRASFSLPALPAAPPIDTGCAPMLAMGSNRISPSRPSPDHWAAFDRNVRSFAYRSRNVPPLSNLKRRKQRPPQFFLSISSSPILVKKLSSFYPYPSVIFPFPRFEERQLVGETTKIGDR